MTDLDNKVLDEQEAVVEAAVEADELAVEALDELVDEDELEDEGVLEDEGTPQDEEALSIEDEPAADEVAVAEEPVEDEPIEDGQDEPADDESEVVPATEEEDDDNSEDSLTFSNGVIEKIVALAMRDVPGVVGMKGGMINRIQDAFGVTDTRKGVTVEVTPESAVRVSVSVFMEYGAYAPQVFEDVKKAVVKQVTGMTGLVVAGVNLRIEDVLTPEEVAERNLEHLSATTEYAEPDLLEE